MQAPWGQEFLSVLFTDTFLAHRGMPTGVCWMTDLLTDRLIDWLTDWMNELWRCDTFCHFASWGLQGHTHIKDSYAAPSLLSPLWQQMCRQSGVSWKAERRTCKNTRPQQGKNHSSYLQTNKEMRNMIYVKLLLNFYFEHLPNERHTVRCYEKK